MALSTTLTQYAQETTKFGKITLNKGHLAVQGHSRSPILVPIERKPIYDFLLVINTNLSPILHRFGVIAFQNPNVKTRYIWLPLLRLNHPTGSSVTIAVKFSVNVDGWPRYQTAKKNCRVGCTNVTDDRQTDDRRKGDSI